VTDQQTVFDHIRAYFGRYKAEWLREELFQLFRQPTYFPELEEPRPTVLVGGRGTGKTTVLKCLSYEGRYELEARDPARVEDAEYVGLYWCIDANRVTAFGGPELPAKSWQRLFAHYLNLEIVGQLCEYAIWFESVTQKLLRIQERDIERVCISLHLSTVGSLADLRDQVDDSLVRLEATVNSIGDGSSSPLSLPSAPIEYMTHALAADTRLKGKLYYILLDEFENLDVNQQQVVNNLIKHGRDRHTLKIGVKKDGWKTKRLLVEGEVLVHPADYDLIDLTDRLTDRAYRDFATEVCNARLQSAFRAAGLSDTDVSLSSSLESLTAEEEARLLGVRRRVDALWPPARGDGEDDDITSSLTDLERFYILTRAGDSRSGFDEEVASLRRDPDAYLANYRSNYRQSLLYAVSQQSGRGVQKYYAGWETLVQVSGSNIRYMVELVERSFSRHRDSGRPISEPISARVQTLACIDVGKKYVHEVQSLDPAGARLTYLLLGLGRFFNVLARSPEGRQPDTTSFVVAPSASSGSNSAISDLLKKAVMHQVLQRRTGTKATSGLEAKEWEYSVHPVFSAFFVIPYQKKRRIHLQADDLLTLSEDVRGGLSKLLADRRITPSSEGPLPGQMTLFESLYG
jgi:hypothetical protein